MVPGGKILLITESEWLECSIPVPLFSWPEVSFLVVDDSVLYSDFALHCKKEEISLLYITEQHHCAFEAHSVRACLLY